MIACLTHSGDFYTIDLVMKAIEDAGLQAVRINTDLLNHQTPFTYRKVHSKFTYQTSISQLRQNEKKIKAIWNRKIWPVTIPEDLDPNYHAIFRQEYHTYRNIFLEQFSELPWMNPDDADTRVADNKFAQLQKAHACDLEVPISLFTNNAEQLNDFFYEQCRGKMIAKLHGVLSVSMNGMGPNFPTTLIEANQLKVLSEQLPYCPMIFQEYIAKAFELRIAYIDGYCFAGKVNTNGSAVDWRGQHHSEGTWKTFELPHLIQQKIDIMMKQSGLYFGLIDMIVTPEGKYVFLEVNPKGEWGMLQKCLHYPIAETIVQQLIAKIPS